MRAIATRACWYESNTCDSCWIGAKNRFRYSRKAISSPTFSEPLATSTLPAPSTIAAAMLDEEVDEREVDRDEPLRLDARVAVSGGDLGELLLVAFCSRTNACETRTPESPSCRLAFTAAMLLARGLVGLATTASGTRASR